MKKGAPRKAGAVKRGKESATPAVSAHALSVPQPFVPQAVAMLVEAAVPAPQFVTVTIENVTPLVDGGRYPIKRVWDRI